MTARISRSASLLVVAASGLAAGAVSVAPLFAEEGELGSRQYFDDKRLGAEASFYADTNGVSVVTPRVSGSAKRDHVSVRGGYLADIVSAASVDIVTTASARWQEVRQEGSLSTELELDAARLRASGSASVEPDYVALAGRLLSTFELGSKNSVLGVAYSYSNETAGRTGTPFNVYSQLYERHGVTATLEATLDRRTLVLLDLSGSYELGDSKKPYRMLPLFSAEDAASLPSGASVAEVNALRLPGRTLESVPGERARASLTTRLLRRFERATFQATARLYSDTWQLTGVTAELRFTRELGERFRLVTHARTTIQSGVYFWERAYVATLSSSGELELPRYRTGDRELGPLLFGSFGPTLLYVLGGAERGELGTLGFFALGTLTHFSDALYLRERASALVGLSWEQAFE